jgi:hypothetical protein
MMKKSPLAIFLCCAVLSCFGGNAEESIVKGVVVDVQDGEPLIGVRVEGPRSTRAVTDPKGRFVLKGLRVGDEGEVRAWRSDGWEAQVSLRPLASEGIDIVLHLAP